MKEPENTEIGKLLVVILFLMSCGLIMWGLTTYNAVGGFIMH